MALQFYFIIIVHGLRHIGFHRKCIFCCLRHAFATHYLRWLLAVGASGADDVSTRTHRRFREYVAKSTKTITRSDSNAMKANVTQSSIGFSSPHWNTFFFSFLLFGFGSWFVFSFYCVIFSIYFHSGWVWKRNRRKICAQTCEVEAARQTIFKQEIPGPSIPGTLALERIYARK